MANEYQQLMNGLPETQDIARQRKMAQLLLQQGLSPSQGQMVSGRYVGTHPLEHIAKLANIYVSKNIEKEADAKQQQLAEALRRETSQDLSAFMEAQRNRPAQEQILSKEAKTLPAGQTMLDEMNQATLVQAAMPERKADYAKALSIALGSRSPLVQSLGTEMLKQSMTPQKLGPDESLVTRDLFGGDGEAYKSIATGKEKLTDEQKEYRQAVKEGFTGTFYDYKAGLKKAGAPNVSVSSAKDLAGQVGDISKESRVAATGAVQSAEAANRIIGAVDSNKLFSGVGANQRLTAAQIADGLGLGGKDTSEKIGNSRQAIQGLAQLTLQGRKQMRGEGAITENEGKLAERAMSGDISLTGAEIRQLAEAAKRSAKFQYSQHQNIINTMKSDPSTKGLVPYYDVPADVSIFEPRKVGGQSSTRDAADAIIGGR